MKRRALILAGAAGLFLGSTAFPVRAQKAVPRIGVLTAGTPSSMRDRLEALRSELKRLGYVEGRNITFEVRYAESKPARLASLAAELVVLDPAVIVTASSAGVIAAKNATRTIPIVFATASAPVEQGFVASLRRPGGNVTGVTLHRMDEKVVEIIREALPQARRVAVLVHKSDPFGKLVVESIMPAAKRLKFEALIIEISRGEDLAIAFNDIVRQKADILYGPRLSFILAHREFLVERALEARLPLVTGYAEITGAGGLLSYGTSGEENYRRVAVLVDKILRGANPAELPVEQPEKLELIVNAKTAKLIGVSLPRSIMLRANRVIE